MNRKTFLITGATGFIGTNLVERLKNEGHKVFRLVLPGKSIKDSDNFFYVDITKIKKLRKLFNDKKIKPDIIIHLAAHVDSKKDYLTSKRVIQTNILGTLNMLEVAKEFNIRYFIHMGTEESYGNISPPFSEKDRLDPHTPYAISKVATEYFSMMYYRVYKLPVVLLRFAAIYGPRQNCTKLIPMSIISALEGKNIVLHSPSQKRNFLFIDDAINGILKICFSERNIKGEVFNFGGVTLYSIREVVKKIITIIGTPVKIIEKRNTILSSEPKKVISDISKAKDILRWFPATSLEDGLKKTVAWYRQNK